MSATDRPLTAATRLFTRIVEDPLNAGLALLVATAAALIVANSALSSDYVGLFKTYVAGLSIGHWINDGLMAGFFLLVGLELKREIIDGELSTWSQRILPGIAAAGGIIVPALIFSALNWNDDEAMAGWAIPTATDIAFALGILLLLGSRIPVALKVLLTTIAVLDDLVAIAIIALFYTADLSMAMLGLAGVALVGLLLLNRSGISALWPYLVTGLVLWFFVLQSGVHATLAGVALAVAIPFKSGTRSPLRRLEHAIQPWVAFLILPVFA
ncbi:MAG: Na+/H+ antiporter NhaA, partial [Chitinophagales bacterium]|nr:Na+/H+ antiporter NhaA [Hyphomicrobiales bacterium]